MASLFRDTKHVLFAVSHFSKILPAYVTSLPLKNSENSARKSETAIRKLPPPPNFTYAYFMREIYFIDANLLDSRTKEKSRQDFLHAAKHVSFAAESASLWNSSGIISPLLTKIQKIPKRSKKSKFESLVFE